MLGFLRAFHRAANFFPKVSAAQTLIIIIIFIIPIRCSYNSLELKVALQNGISKGVHRYLQSNYPEADGDNVSKPQADSTNKRTPFSELANILKFMPLTGEAEIDDQIDFVSDSVATSVPSMIATVYGSVHSTAYYFINVGVGRPSVQRQSLILDTGSSVTAFPCNTCISCGSKHVTLPFNLGLSKSIRDVRCSSKCAYCNIPPTACAYMVEYVEGSSLKGLWHMDYFTFETIRPHNSGHNTCVRNYAESVTPVSQHSCVSAASIFTPFGCHSEETHLFLTQKASGIMGLELHSQFGPTTFVEAALLHSSPPLKKVFSLCLTEHGGEFTVGGTHVGHHRIDHKGYSWTPFAKDTETYTVGIACIKIEKQSIHCNYSGGQDGSQDVVLTGLVDSGTTLTYFPSNLFMDLVSYIRDYIDKKQKGTAEGQSLFMDQNFLAVESESDFTTVDADTVVENPSRRFEIGSNLSNKSRSSNSTSRRLKNQNAGIYEIEVDRSTGSFSFLNTPGYKGRKLDEVSLPQNAQTSAPLRRTRAVPMRRGTKETCWFLTDADSDLDFFPDITISLMPSNSFFSTLNSQYLRVNEQQVSNFIWRSDAYLYTKGDRRFRCLAFAEDTQSAREIVLGSTFMINHDIVFDLENLRLGFAKASCPSSSFHVDQGNPVFGVPHT